MVTEAILRDGSKLVIGDEVTTNWHRDCEGQVFVVCEINHKEACESKAMVLAHLKGHPDRILKGIGHGLDANWFKKII
jgi:hypothetical protein